MRPAWATGSQGSFENFEKFCIANLSLTKKTVGCHRAYYNYVSRFVKPELASMRDIQEIIVRRKQEGKSIHNLIKFIRVFYGKFLGLEWAKSFKVPQPIIQVKTIPTRKQLKTFFENLPSDKARTVFLLLASSGLRLSEALNARIDLENKMIIPNSHQGETKKSYVSFFNGEAEEWLLKTGAVRVSRFRVEKWFKQTSDKTGIRITAKTLREWFCSEMARLGIPDRYVDAFCGRVPRSVLAKHYSDYSIDRLKEIYEKANLRILED
ncbi:MAG: integrase [Thermoproteota archaeon]